MSYIKKDCIADFISSWRAWDLSRRSESVPQWNHRFRDAGYHSVESSRDSVVHSWNEMHQWCQEQFGEDHYAWAGSTFWFESDRDAVLFSLRWA